MEEGSLRCDANISLRPYGQEAFGTKTELKNLNSFSFVQKGLEHEQVRQEKVLLSGGVIQQETRRFDEASKTTILMRVKEGADDYRYFPEPDLVDLYIDEAWKEKVRAEIPELPDARKARYVTELDLPAYDAMVLTQSINTADFFEATLKAGADPKQAANWIMGEVMAYLNAQNKELADLPLTPEALAKMIGLIENGTISSKIAKKVFTELVKNGGDPEQIVKEKGLVQISDEGALRDLIMPIIEANKQSLIDYKNGKDRALGFLVGQVMKATKGQANPPLVNKIILEEVEKV
jgi:aspartyl-tRNA(Asn)/glutamyl-tRNA(Gln) amidotransferase subunit B